jgi:hypothetical protein
MRKNPIQQKLAGVYATGLGLPGPRADGTWPMAELIKEILHDPSDRRKRLQKFLKEFPEQYKWFPDADPVERNRLAELIGDPQSGAWSAEYIAEQTAKYFDAVLAHATNPDVATRLITMLRSSEPSS